MLGWIVRATSGEIEAINDRLAAAMPELVRPGERAVPNVELTEGFACFVDEHCWPHLTADEREEADGRPTLAGLLPDFD